MKTKLERILIALCCIPVFGAAPTFDAGSNGSLGDVIINQPVTIDLPPDGVLHYRTLQIQANAVVTFRRNALNSPVYILAQGDVLIEGTITLDGQRGSATAGGLGGPGGFDGGRPGSPGQQASAGYGPGGGGPGMRANDAGNVGAAGFLTDGSGSSTRNGKAYGNALLLPLVGGSGGGGLDFTPSLNGGAGGGGGGGALLVASSTRVRFNQPSGKVITAFGADAIHEGRGPGSGGAVRAVAPILSGQARVSVGGGNGNGAGRVRFDTLDATQLTATIAPNVNSVTYGGVMIARLNPEPRLDIVEAAGTTIAEGHPELIQIILPNNSNPNRTVTLQARDFTARVPVEVVLTPDSGLAILVSAEIDNTTVNPARLAIPVTFPVNVGVTVSAWVRGR